MTLSRKLFSFLFNKLGNIFKSKKIIYSNLEIFEKNISLQKKEKIISNMWLNYGMTFIEYIFLSYFRKNYSHITIEGENYLNNILKKENQLFLFLVILLTTN